MGKLAAVTLHWAVLYKDQAALGNRHKYQSAQSELREDLSGLCWHHEGLYYASLAEATCKFFHIFILNS